MFIIYMCNEKKILKNDKLKNTQTFRAEIYESF